MASYSPSAEEAELSVAPREGVEEVAADAPGARPLAAAELVRGERKARAADGTTAGPVEETARAADGMPAGPSEPLEPTADDTMAAPAG